MARKRMLDPGFWTDVRIKNLTPIERLFFLGCVSAADDEGRLIGNPAFLRSSIFRYDEIALDEVEAMRDHVAETIPGFVTYQDDGEVYIAFRNWADYQKPSYAKASSLPEPPFVRDSSEKGEASSQPRPNRVPSIVQDSIGKDSVGKESARERDPRLDHQSISGYRTIARMHVPVALRDDWIACAEEVGTEKLLAFTKEWIGNGWNKQNVNGIMEYARKGGEGKHGKSTRSGPALTPEEEAMYHDTFVGSE